MKRFLRSQFNLLTATNLVHWFRFNFYLRSLASRARQAATDDYRLQSSEELATLRRSDRVYVFGSGYSLNEIPAEEWSEFTMHDTIGFNAFVRERWIPVSFHLIRGWGEGANVGYNWRKEVGELGALIRENPYYANTIFLLQDEHFAQVSRTLLAERFLPTGSRVCFYRTASSCDMPSLNLDQGLTHLSGTLSDAVNLAFCLGWREIVLVGVDLYDTRYFWLKPDETFFTDFKTGERKVASLSDRGQRYDEPHSTARLGVVEEIGSWQRFMARHGVSLSIYNPRSLLAETLPLFDRNPNLNRT